MSWAFHSRLSLPADLHADQRSSDSFVVGFRLSEMHWRGSVAMDHMCFS
jgi:hypothetical protein